jgi:FKBP-type peptidyl-prolyl cis-trans isomerase FkpA
MRVPASRRQGRTSIGFLAVTAATLCAGLALAQQPPSDATTAAAPAKKAAAAAERSPSYSLGVSMGTQLKNNGVTAESVNTTALGQGVHDALSGKTTLSDADQASIQKLIMQAATAGGEANHRAAAKFLAENGKKPGVVTTASGLEYKVLTPGSGAAPGPTDEVTVNYRGSLLNGTEFDSSYKRHEPAKFPLNHVIPGWSEGVGLMKPGAKYQFWVPPQLAYDMNSPPGIQPGSLLVFEVELLSVKPAAAAAPAAAPTPTPAPAK